MHGSILYDFLKDVGGHTYGVAPLCLVFELKHYCRPLVLNGLTY